MTEGLDQRELDELLLYRRVLTCCERVDRAGSALFAAADAEAQGYGPSARVDWQEAELVRLRRECAHSARELADVTGGLYNSRTGAPTGREGGR